MDNSGNVISDRYPWLWIFVIAGALIYVPFIGGVHLFDWDEINFAEISREMITTGDYLRAQVDYKPFFEKPPFFFWIQAGSMHVFGINEFAARLPNALCGILVLVFLYRLGTHWVDRRFGILWTLSYLGSLLPTLYHKSGIIDPWFNLFIFASIASWVEGWRRKEIKWYFISGVLCGLSVLTKGPVAPLVIGLTLLSTTLFLPKSRLLSISAIVLFVIGCVLTAGIWFGIEWLVHGPDFITSFIKYQIQLLSESVAGHKGFPGYHFVIALLGIFPASIFALAAFRKKTAFENLQTSSLRLMMIVLTLVILVLFTIVKSKIVHYSSLAYYPVSFLSAWSLYYLLERKLLFKNWNTLIGLVVALIITLVLFALPVIGMNIEKIKENFSFDPFTAASFEANVVWKYEDFIPGIFFLIVIGLMYSFYKRARYHHAIISLFIGTALMMNLFLIFFIGKIEHYSQRAAIEFYKTKEGQTVEIETLGFHSYAPFFYAKKPQPVSGRMVQKFFVVKADKRSILNENPDLKMIYEENGFIFLK